jgi:hypothetical protein
MCLCVYVLRCLCWVDADDMMQIEPVCYEL